MITLHKLLSSAPYFWWGPCCSSFLVFYVVFFSLFVFVLCFVYPMLPLSLDCSFLIAPLVFSNVYFLTECILPFSSIAKTFPPLAIRS